MNLIEWTIYVNTAGDFIIRGSDSIYQLAIHFTLTDIYVTKNQMCETTNHHTGYTVIVSITIAGTL